MAMTITIKADSKNQKCKDIDFDVTGTCPHCENVTSITEDEFRSGECQCMHCDEILDI